jgi:hypothetical protein
MAMIDSRPDRRRLTKLAHIINPLAVRETSDLFIAQPITFRTMMEAKACAAPRVQVELLTTQFPEDRGIAPSEFITSPDLTRSILDFGTFSYAKRLPLIKDILDRLYETTDAEGLIYTNVDIAVQPYFYLAVAEFMSQGFDAFSINRRVISDRFKRPEETVAMWSEVGKRHGGHDCFVFHRSLYPNFRLGKVCVGTSGVGRTILFNFLCHGKKPMVFMDKHLTFHIGDVEEWRDKKSREMLEFNARESELALQQLESEFGQFKRTQIGACKLSRRPRKQPIKRLVLAVRSFRSGK